jgi:hypothetical protein
MKLADILDECLGRLQTGESIESCLARYGERAAELAPMLVTATRLQALAGYRLSDAQRLRAKVALREALAERADRRSWPAGGAILGRARGLALAGLTAVLLCLTVAVTAVAASQPGHPAYPLRVAAERVPILFQTAPANRVAAEINVAERRLSDLRSHLEKAGQVHPVALNALLDSDEAAARGALALSETERAEVATRVVEHARVLTRLAQAAPEPQAANALNMAATQTLAIAGRLRAGLPAPEPWPADRPMLPPLRETPTPQAPTATPTRPTPPEPRPTVTTTPTVPTPTPTATPTPGPADLDRPPHPEPPRAGTFEPGHLATAVLQTVTALRPDSTPPREHPIETAAAHLTRLSENTPPEPRPTDLPGPGHVATAIAQTVTAMPPVILLPRVATRVAETPEATPPAPGHLHPPWRGDIATAVVETVTAWLPGAAPGPIATRLSGPAEAARSTPEPTPGPRPRR